MHAMYDKLGCANGKAREKGLSVVGGGNTSVM